MKIANYMLDQRLGVDHSPVFFNLGTTRVFNGQVRTATTPGPMIFLCGVIHGHYDTDSDNVDHTNEDVSLTAEKINMGIAIVTPIHKALEVIHHNAQQNTPNFAFRE